MIARVVGASRRRGERTLRVRASRLALLRQRLEGLREVVFFAELQDHFHDAEAALDFQANLYVWRYAQIIIFEARTHEPR